VRILVAEDDGPLADVLFRGLQRNGYVVDVARRGDDALTYLRTNDYAAAVIDWGMPGLQGTDVISKARAAGSATPVLMLTARDTTFDRVKGLDAGADDYLVKPFDFDELLARIRALLRRSHQVAEPTLRTADLSLDPATNEVHVRGELTRLTPREYAILELLMRQSPKTVARAAIAEQVWDIGDEISWNAIEAHIARLRAKVARADVRILAVRNVGYRLVPG
jgi:DNA-binding response OmpR family regulator